MARPGVPLYALITPVATDTSLDIHGIWLFFSSGGTKGRDVGGVTTGTANFEVNFGTRVAVLVHGGLGQFRLTPYQHGQPVSLS